MFMPPPTQQTDRVSAAAVDYALARRRADAARLLLDDAHDTAALEAAGAAVSEASRAVRAAQAALLTAAEALVPAAPQGVTEAATQPDHPLRAETRAVEYSGSREVSEITLECGHTTLIFERDRASHYRCMACPPVSGDARDPGFGIPVAPVHDPGFAMRVAPVQDPHFLVPVATTYPLRAIVGAAEVQGQAGSFLVTLECGHKLATRKKEVHYVCRNCPPDVGIAVQGAVAIEPDPTTGGTT